MIEDAQRGSSVNLLSVSVGAMAAKFVPELNALELPYIFESSEEVDYVLKAITMMLKNDSIKPVSNLLCGRKMDGTVIRLTNV